MVKHHRPLLAMSAVQMLVRVLRIGLKVREELTINTPFASGSIETLLSDFEPAQSASIIGAGVVYFGHVCHDGSLVRRSDWIVRITSAFGAGNAVVPLHPELITWGDLDYIL